MRKVIFGFIMLISGGVIFSQNADNVELNSIVSGISQYKNKTVTLKLRLRNFDKIFERITFYDAKNHDIEFDISRKELRKKLHDDLLDLHEGLDYYVTFTVNEAGNLGQIIADIAEFKPVVIFAIPEK